MKSVQPSDVFALRAQILRLETLYDAARALPLRRGARDIATEVVERAVALLDAARGVVLLLGTGGEVEEEVAVGRPGRTTGSARWRGEPFVARVLAGSEAVASGPGRGAGDSFRSVLGAPLRGAGEVFGAILLFDREARSGEKEPLFDDEDGRFLAALAALGGAALDGVRRLERLEDERRRLLEENRLLRGPAPGEPELIGEARSFRLAVDLARRAAPSRVTVLVRGESGTGKEMIARLLHAGSDRARGPFIALNCSAIPETLLESELFGIERGVATGVEARPGKFELADGGTIFLDEIGDMPPALQAKLLRVLAEKEFERVGGKRRIRVDVRIVAATHRALEEMVAAGRFREDLLYRLRVIEIRLPPLRERREDLPLLVRHFVRKAARDAGAVEPSISREAMAVLLGWSYPGNLRELENLLAGAVALAGGREIGPEELRLLAPRLFSASTTGEATPAGAGFRPIPLREAEREHALGVLRLTGGNKSRAARMLGIDRKTLDRLTGKLSADDPNFLAN